MTPRAQVIAAVALVLAAAVIGAVRAPVPAAPGLAASSAPQDVAMAEPYDPSADLALLQERSPWGAQLRGRAVPRGEAVVGPLAPWRVVGVLNRADGLAAALLFQPQNRLELRRIGESLPDGRRIVDIRPTSILLEAGGVNSTLPLFTGIR
ncbi:hypothetical protein [Roseiterribacter gracilis]|uniref:Type II secretion system protein GspC N-terminal domain-containing protein n=1 Tax=Roseiterribacter gracilis TaxID=2812848 RepID=A0A8S8XKV2_9PROT|nr:hypothetical protein TMPK1_40330 [Rhodospirillales bacterium TMPK1]